ncbi:MAG: autotransporter domain-containing protein [Rhodospirillales bacterium]|nr:autotransporter domain-containing protein [Rhodospirillales bacterium]
MLDADGHEVGRQSLDFRVFLSRILRQTVRIDYATSDGTATAGSDYRATSGTLTFRPGETAKTISVAVLDDSHDEGDERLTLTLSSPRPASRLRLGDATAEGVIGNADPMPKAWIGRFGRAVADQVLDAVDARMRAGPAPGVEARLAGQPIGVGSSLHGFQSSLPSPGLGQTATDRDLPPDTSFSLTGKTQGDGILSIWGRGAATRFSGQDAGAGGDLAVDGEVATGLLGADWKRGDWTAGLVVSRSQGDGGYRGADGGTVTSTLSGVWPWTRYAVGERLYAWGVAGYGDGSLTLEPRAEDGTNAGAIRTDLDLWMAAVGLRGVAVDGGDDGLTLAVKTDAMTVRTGSDAVSGAGGNLAAAEAEATWLRLGLEGSRPFPLADGSVLTPSAEIGLRRDDGDAETGFGVNVGAGIAWADAKRGLGAELRGRGLLTHEAKGFRERGLSGSFVWDPVTGDRGPRLSLSQTVGGSFSGSTDALLERATLAGLATNDNGDALQQRRLEARFGYGFAAFGDRFTSGPEIAVGLSDAGRDYSLGWRLTRGGRESDGSALELALEARRHESAPNLNAPPEHAVGFRATSRF